MGRRMLRRRVGATPREIVDRRLDVGTGTFFSNLVMFFIILTTAMTLHRHGVTRRRDVPPGGRKLCVRSPGRFAELLYTVGLIGVGILAIPTLSGSAAYAFAETFGWRQGLDQKLCGARASTASSSSRRRRASRSISSNVNPVQALYWSRRRQRPARPVSARRHPDRRLATGKLMEGQPQPARSAASPSALTALLMFGAAAGMFLF